MQLIQILIFLPAHTGQHSPGTLMKLIQGDRQCTSEQVVTPSTHMHVMQGVESANQLLPSVCSSPPYIQPARGNISHRNNYFQLLVQSQWCVYLCSEDSRLPDQSPDAYMEVWDTEETNTGPHLPAGLKHISEHRRGSTTQREKTELHDGGQTWQVQLEQRFELRVHACPSLNSFPSSIHTETRHQDRQKGKS